MNGALIVFVLAVAAWAVFRSTLAITEWQRRIVWVATVGLFLLPSFLGWEKQPLVMQVVWPFSAGVMAGELLWTWLRKRMPALFPGSSEVPPSRKRRRKKR